MTQLQLDSLVAAVIGGEPNWLAERGLTPPNPASADEHRELGLRHHVDWDSVQPQRQVAVLPR